MPAFAMGFAAKIVLGLLLAGGIVGGIAYYNHLIASRAVIALQRDALAELARRQAETAAERNRIWAEVQRLPDGRVRLCAIRGPESGCCKPAPAECAP